MRRKIPLIVIILMVINACATVSTINNANSNSPLFFSGTRLDTNTLQNNKVALKKFTVDAPKHPLLDLPASFIADLFISPFTGALALYRVVFE